MDKRQGQIEANEGMHPFVSGCSFAVLFATIFFCLLAFNLLKKKKKKKKTAEKESTKGASAGVGSNQNENPRQGPKGSAEKRLSLFFNPFMPPKNIFRFNVRPQIAMDKGQSQTKANEEMHRFVSGRSFGVLLTTILFCMLAFNLLKKKKKSAEKESNKGTSAGVGSNQYDVFLSFRGLDTRKEFTDHLYHGLVNVGTSISVFKDDNSLPIGEYFDSEILDAITRSKILIPIISKNYASSKWCLRELVRIMDCKKNTSHIVLPIFYKVDPSDVRFLKGSFGEAFHSRKHRFNEKDIEEGRRAFEEVSYLNGWESEKFANGREGELVEKVVETILSKLRHDFPLDVTKHLVGVDDHVNKIRNWVDTPATNARMVGIYGMGGIGKTTLAKVIYNKLSNNFGQHSFVLDIRETVHRHGISYVQNQLIQNINPKERPVKNVDEGINVIKSTFKGKKVLIILDDIDDNDQLNALARERKWFASGSIIIVTTRYKAVLDQSEFGVDYPYELEGLDEADSLLLFKRHAFRMDEFLTDFESIACDIVSTVGRLPLALKVIGSYLYGKTNQGVWEDVLKNIRNKPHGDVQNILKISYDALEHGHQEIFLDIACFFIGKKSKFAIYMWEDCGFYANQGIEELKLRCLIKIDGNDKLSMHDQLRDLGRSIVRQGPPERQSRLWEYDRAFRVLMGKKGTKMIQAVCLHKDHGHPQTYTNEQFKNLQSLRFLQLARVTLSGDYNRLFSELRWLQWNHIESNSSFLATNLHLPKLMVLDLSLNKITEDWRGWSLLKAAKRLKVLDLTFCDHLRCTPDLSAFTELEILILRGNFRLQQVHPSIGKVKSLVCLDLKNCSDLKELPGEVHKLKELKELHLDSTGITQIPTSIGSLRKLEKLSAQCCMHLRRISSSIGNLSSLQQLYLWNCTSLKEIPSSIGDLQNLQRLDVSFTGIVKLPSAIGRLKKLLSLSLKSCLSLKGEIPSEIGDLSSLKILEITETPISYLPKSIRSLSSLQYLGLWGCSELRSLPKLPLELIYLTVSCQSPSLPRLSSLVHLEELVLYKCLLPEYIVELCSRLLKLHVDSCCKLRIPKLDGFKYLEELSIQSCNSIKMLDLSKLTRLKRLHVDCCSDLVEIQANYDLEFLERINIYHCLSFKRLILPELECLKVLKILECQNLLEIRGLDRARSLEELDIYHCPFIEGLPDQSYFASLNKLRIDDNRSSYAVLCHTSCYGRMYNLDFADRILPNNQETDDFCNANACCIS